MKKRSYSEFCKKKERIMSAFPGLFFAFGNEQMKAAIEKYKIGPDNKIVDVGYGGFVLRKNLSKYQKLQELFCKWDKEFISTENGFKNALKYELNNHEYCVTCDPTDALEAAIGVSFIEDLTAVQQGWVKECCKYVMENSSW